MDNDESDIIVMMFPGLGSYGQWALHAKEFLINKGIQSEIISYDRHRLVHFLFPFGLVNNNSMKIIEKQVKDIFEHNKNKKKIVIAHSFGSYIFSKIFYKFENMRVHKIILFGSVLKRSFPWFLFRDRIDVNVINIVGEKDFWPAVADFLPHYGCSGTFFSVGPFVINYLAEGATHSELNNKNFFENNIISYFDNSNERTQKEAKNSSRGIFIAILAYKNIFMTFISALLFYYVFDRVVLFKRDCLVVGDPGIEIDLRLQTGEVIRSVPFTYKTKTYRLMDGLFQEQKGHEIVKGERLIRKKEKNGYSLVKYATHNKENEFDFYVRTVMLICK